MTPKQILDLAECLECGPLNVSDRMRWAAELRKHAKAIDNSVLIQTPTPEEIHFFPGDIVAHRGEDWTCTVERVEMQESYRDGKELIVFFVEGGFWRASQLRLVSRPSNIG